MQFHILMQCPATSEWSYKSARYLGIEGNLEQRRDKVMESLETLNSASEQELQREINSKGNVATSLKRILSEKAVNLSAQSKELPLPKTTPIFQNRKIIHHRNTSIQPLIKSDLRSNHKALKINYRKRP